MQKKASCDKKIVDILWTGGFDSTFRIVQLSRYKVLIQPYYLSDQRKSEPYELKTIEQIVKKLRAHEMTKCKIAPLIIIDKNQREEQSEVSAAFNRILERDFIGSQYKWLASFALKHSGIELSVHEDDKAISVIKKYGKFMLCCDDTIGEYFEIDRKLSLEDIWLLFGNFHFPLVKYTKIQMREAYIANGYEDIMNLTWFCHSPVRGCPCGICNPCRYTIKEGLKERFTTRALLRYHLRVGEEKLFDKLNKFSKRR